MFDPFTLSIYKACAHNTSYERKHTQMHPCALKETKKIYSFLLYDFYFFIFYQRKVSLNE